MQIKNIATRFSKVLLNPKVYWRMLDLEVASADVLCKKIMPIMMAVEFSFILFGAAINDLSETNIWLLALDSLLLCLLFFAFYIVEVFITKLISSAFSNVTKYQIYVYVLVNSLPLYLVVAVSAIFPSLIFLWLFCGYIPYLMYCGAKSFLRVENDNMLIFMILNVLVFALGTFFSFCIRNVIMNLFL